MLSLSSHQCNSKGEGKRKESMLAKIIPYHIGQNMLMIHLQNLRFITLEYRFTNPNHFFQHIPGFIPKPNKTTNMHIQKRTKTNGIIINK